MFKKFIYVKPQKKQKKKTEKAIIKSPLLSLLT